MTNILASRQSAAPQPVNHSSQHMPVVHSGSEKAFNSTGAPMASTMSQLPPIKKSLNREARKRELMKITQEN